jgi:hypothetical protein
VNIDNVEKKLREAEFFLDKMRDQERKAFGDKEPFDFYLSAFLNAGRVVDYRLRHEQGAIYWLWRVAWNAKLPINEQELIEFLVKDRNVEVHESGSRRDAKIEGLEVGGSYSDASGTLEIFGSPGARLGTNTKVVIYKSVYWFTIQGIDRKATEACEEYLLLLKRMVAQFKTDNP